MALSQCFPFLIITVLLPSQCCQSPILQNDVLAKTMQLPEVLLVLFRTTWTDKLMLKGLFGGISRDSRLQAFVQMTLVCKMTRLCQVL